MNESGTHGHRVLWKRTLYDVEGLACDEIVQADDSLAIKTRVSLREVIAAIRAKSVTMPMIKEN